MFLFRKPLLPNHYFLWFEPPDESGDEVLRIVSERRSLKLKGHSFREFHKSVTPLLDGSHTMEEICARTSDKFDPDDLDAALRLLAAQGIVVEGDSPDANALDALNAERIAPQLNFFHETCEGGRALQKKLTDARVDILGLGGAGSHLALGLASAGIGRIGLIDALPVRPTDVYFAPFFAIDDIGHSRAATVAKRMAGCAPDVQTHSVTHALNSEEDIWRAIEGSTYVVSCLDNGLINLSYKLNRVCITHKLRWIASSLEGSEVVIGPAFEPDKGPCFMCYRMRSVSCAANPVSSFAWEQYLDRKKTDLSDRRENLVFGAGIVANLLGIETLKAITGTTGSLSGRLLTFNLADMSMRKHCVLRKPKCPACFARENHLPQVSQ